MAPSPRTHRWLRGARAVTGGSQVPHAPWTVGVESVDAIAALATAVPDAGGSARALPAGRQSEGETARERCRTASAQSAEKCTLPRGRDRTTRRDHSPGARTTGSPSRGTARRPPTVAGDADHAPVRVRAVVTRPGVAHGRVARARGARVECRQHEAGLAGAGGERRGPATHAARRGEIRWQTGKRSIGGSGASLRDLAEIATMGARALDASEPAVDSGARSRRSLGWRLWARRWPRSPWRERRSRRPPRGRRDPAQADPRGRRRRGTPRPRPRPPPRPRLRRPGRARRGHRARGRSRAAPPARDEVTPSDARAIPGTFGDAFQALAALPGLAPMASGLPFFYVRGAPPADTGYFVDGVPVPTLFHIGPGASIVPEALVDHVDFFPGAAPARYGRFVGGIIAGQTTEPSPVARGEASVRLFDASAFVESPMGESSNVRRRWPLRLPEPPALDLRADALASLRRLHVSLDAVALGLRPDLALRPRRLRSRGGLDGEPRAHRLAVSPDRPSLRPQAGRPDRCASRPRSATTGRRQHPGQRRRDGRVDERSRSHRARRSPRRRRRAHGRRGRERGPLRVRGESGAGRVALVRHGLRRPRRPRRPSATRKWRARTRT